ncbi:preprotein translocase subunit SecE [Sagittula stellata]|uniref:Uncharacterized protein n=1 Tax=Sagittula stellata (strain ATCC 700073 / DSM 11524 / E-37) TaxID=388399 RepID=A3K1S3_SAGS3|nr:preprotein translocase subunit SecE [Sagittula stellata]EBA08869.1 hypothetical protein SSE37_04465 [Sagittula stellata E-37]
MGRAKVGKRTVIAAHCARLFVVAAMIVIGLAPGAVRAEACNLPAGLVTLARTLSALPQKQQAVDTLLAERISTQMADLSEFGILTDLQRNSLDGLSGIALELMAEGERLSYAAAPYDPRHLRAMLAEFEHQSTLACNSISEESDADGPGTFRDAVTEGRIDWEEVEKMLEENKVVSGGVVLAIMVVFIGLLFGVDLAIRWIFALVHNRRACRVGAILTFGEAEVHGLILTLGRGGFRFHPRDMEALLVGGADTGVPFRLQVGQCAPFDGRMSMVRDHVVDCRFDAPLTLRLQAEILALSSISPYYVRRSHDGGEESTLHLARQEQDPPLPNAKPKET